MTEIKQNKTKFSWTMSLFRKWFNIKSKKEKYPPDDPAYDGGEAEWKAGSLSERKPSNVKETTKEKFNLNNDHLASCGDYLEHPKIVDVQNHSVFVATWNVCGKSPPSHMNLDDWLHASPAADIYVLGFQEIVPLNPSNILGTEDDGPAKKWVSLIRRTLNNRPGMCGSSGNHSPSPALNPAVEINADFDRFYSHKAASVFPRRSFQATESWISDSDPSITVPQLERRYSFCDRVIFGQRPSNYRSSDYSRASDYSASDYRPSDFRPSDVRPSDFRRSDVRPSDFRRSDVRPSDFSRLGSSDDDYGPGDSPNHLLFSPMPGGGGGLPRQQRYCLVVSKQMVGIFLMVWVKKDLREHVRNVKVSCVGRGLMGYLGNKGSISVSFLLHQTSFCFVCTHLSSGQKEGDELRRNADVMEIIKKTRFPRVNSNIDEKSPETIVDHDRVIWLGDLNYRLTLPYRPVRALVEMQNWRALLERDQLRIEQRRGRVFMGWNEGSIYFPPTYKYSHNSDRYAGDDMHHKKKKRRTPAWCDRILWYGKGLHQLSYVRAESRFSDHRPVYSIFWAEVEPIPLQLKRSKSCFNSPLEVADLLPYSNGYTELCFF